MSGRSNGLVVAMIGVALLVAAGWMAVDTEGFVAAASIADGRVVRLNAGGSHPEIAFTTAAGQPVEYPQGGMIFGYVAGEAVRVLYRPDDARASATLDSFGALWGEKLVVAGIGLVMLGLGGMVLFMRNPPIGIYVRGR